MTSHRHPSTCEPGFPRERLSTRVRLRVLSFNLRVDTPTDGPLSWANRREAAGEVARAARPDVIATQEGLAEQLRDLDRSLPGFARVGQGRRGGSKDEHCALYFDATRFSVEEAGDFWLSDRPDEAASASWGNALPRMVTWARLAERGTGERVTVASTHFDHRSAASRARSAALLAQRLPGAVLAGDFNALPGSTPHATLARAGWADAASAARASGAGAASASAAGAASAAAAGTFHGFTGQALARIDWVLVPQAARSLAHRVLTARPRGTWPSDHFPVLADVAL